MAVPIRSCRSLFPASLRPRERHELARETARELLGERFAYTLAVHTPLAKDNIEQPHMHLMFSERVVDSNTQSLSEEQFFKRNGAKKDPEWNSRGKPMEVREKWVEMMNAAMERHGHIQDPAAAPGCAFLGRPRPPRSRRAPGAEDASWRWPRSGGAAPGDRWAAGAAGRAACAAPERGQGDRALGTGSRASRSPRCRSARPAS